MNPDTLLRLAIIFMRNQYGPGMIEDVELPIDVKRSLNSTISLRSRRFCDRLMFELDYGDLNNAQIILSNPNDSYYSCQWKAQNIARERTEAVNYCEVFYPFDYMTDIIRDMLSMYISKDACFHEGSCSSFKDCTKFCCSVYDSLHEHVKRMPCSLPFLCKQREIDFINLGNNCYRIEVGPRKCLSHKFDSSQYCYEHTMHYYKYMSKYFFLVFLDDTCIDDIYRKHILKFDEKYLERNIILPAFVIVFSKELDFELINSHPYIRRIFTFVIDDGEYMHIFMNNNDCVFLTDHFALYNEYMHNEKKSFFAPLDLDETNYHELNPNLEFMYDHLDDYFPCELECKLYPANDFHLTYFHKTYNFYCFENEYNLSFNEMIKRVLYKALTFY